MLLSIKNKGSERISLAKKTTNACPRLLSSSPAHVRPQVASSTREALAECRAAKATVEETLALALRTAAKEKAELDDRLAAASEARRLTAASELATAEQLAAAEQRERELRDAVAAKEVRRGGNA